MTNKKPQEIFEHSLNEGKYIAVGKPIVLKTTDHSPTKEIEESKFQKTLEDILNTVQFPQEAEFFMRGDCEYLAEIREDEGKSRYLQRNYIPVQFYKTAKFQVSIL